MMGITPYTFPISEKFSKIQSTDFASEEELASNLINLELPNDLRYHPYR